MKSKAKKKVKQKAKPLARSVKVKSTSVKQQLAKAKATSSGKRTKSKPLPKVKLNGRDSPVAKVEKVKKPKKQKIEVEKTLEAWLWDAACAIRGAQEAPKFKDYILPLVFVKRLCDVFDDEVNRLAQEFGSKKVVLKLLEKDRKLVRFYLPFRPVDVETQSTWEVIKLMTATSTKSLGQQLTDLMHDIARENPKLNRIVNRIDYNNTTHGVREIADDRLEILINRLSTKKLGLKDVEPDIIGRSYEYLIRKFAEGAGQSAGEFYSPTEAGLVMARILDPEPGMTCYDPTIGSAGLVIKLQLALLEKVRAKGLTKYEPLKMYGQEYLPLTWAMANMNMVIHEMEGEIKIGDTMKNPDLLTPDKKGLMQFDRITANPMWNQDVFTAKDYEKDEYNRFENRIPPAGSADWGWMQHILASLKPNGRAAVILDTGAVSRGSGSESKSAEKEIRKWFVDNDFIEGVIYLPENLFYNTTAPGVVIFISKSKPTHLKSKVILVNATRCFSKGNPKNFIDATNQRLIETAYQHLYTTVQSIESPIQIDDGKGGGLIVSKSDIIKNDYNISPTKYINTTQKKELPPIQELVVELRRLDEQASKINEEVNTFLNKLGY